MMPDDSDAPVGNAPMPPRRRRGLGRRWKFLAGASALLDETLDYETTLANVVRLAIPAIADHAGIVLLAPDGSASWAYSAHREASRMPLVERLRAFDPSILLLTDSLPGGWQVTTPRLIASVGDEDLRAVAHDAVHLALLRELAPVSYLGVPLVSRGRGLGILVLCTTPASGRTYGEQDLALAGELGRRAALAVDRARLYREAERARQAREAMIAVVAHDLKNPLSTIQMATSLLLGDVVPDDEAHRLARRHLAIVDRATARMRRLIHDLLDVSAIEAGRMRLQCSPHRARSLVEDALEMLRPLAAAKAIALEVEVPAELPAVSVDNERVLQVFGNIGGNAIKFTPAGGRVRIGVEPGLGRDPVVEFIVSDTGPGIAPDDLTRVFDPYWRAAKVSRSGTGLGLAIAKGIVEAHGGQIGATSILGRGSSFWFTLPAAVSRSASPAGESCLAPRAAGAG
jgi:signal transduction histidine kinase